MLQDEQLFKFSKLWALLFLKFIRIIAQSIAQKNVEILLNSWLKSFFDKCKDEKKKFISLAVSLGFQKWQSS